MSDTAEKLSEAAEVAAVAATEIKAAETRAEIAEENAAEAVASAEAEKEILEEITHERRIENIEKDVSTWADHLKTFQTSTQLALESLQTMVQPIADQLTRLTTWTQEIEAKLSIPQPSEPKPEILAPEELPHQRNAAENPAPKTKPQFRAAKKRRL